MGELKKLEQTTIDERVLWRLKSVCGRVKAMGSGRGSSTHVALWWKKVM